MFELSLDALVGLDTNRLSHRRGNDQREAQHPILQYDELPRVALQVSFTSLSKTFLDVKGWALKVECKANPKRAFIEVVI